MRDEHDGDVHFFPDLQQIRLHLATGLGVERAERLVHDEDARVVGQRAGDGDALFHTTGEFMRIRIFKFRQADHVEPLTGLRIGGGRGLAVHFQAEHHIALHRKPREERVALKDHAAIRPGSGDGLAIQKDFAAARLVQAGHDADQGGFATARRPDDADKFPAADVERNVIEHHLMTVIGNERFFQITHA